MSMEKLLSKVFVPKNDTQQSEFLQKYPSFDGRGIKIAIIDSGVDVSLDGLQKTSTGLPKIIDCFNFTDAGEVDTSMIQKTGKYNTLILLSGRKINIPQKWKNPSKEWHLGVYCIRHIRPEALNKDEENRKMEEGPKDDRIIYYKNCAKMISEEDAMDCIVWKNGQKWQVCLITPDIKNENIKNIKVLTNFRDDHEYCFIFESVACCVTIKNDGNLLELSIPHCYHGSAVAQVAAAHFPGNPDSDGLAPGAQIISIILSDTIKSIKKMLKKCIEMNVDIVNFSITSQFFNESTIKNLLKEMVNKHGIIIIKSAMNDGPIISSMKNSIISEMFTIGALRTHEIKALIYGKNKNDNKQKSVWYYSSRGPLPNGARGVTFVAPAEAIFDNPKWHLMKRNIFVGTSCAAPNAAGAIACLLSGLKANSIPYTAATIKMALSNTALLPDVRERLGFGNGMIQISSAFEYFKTFKQNLSKIKVPELSVNGINQTGIIVCKTENDKDVFDYDVQTDNQIPWILKLSPKSHQKRIEHPTTITNNLFKVKINTNSLKPGNFYYSEIHGFDPSNLSLGPIFYLPITVILPENVINYSIQKEISFKSPSIYNLYIHPEQDSKKCIIKLSGTIEYQKIIKKEEHENNEIFSLTYECQQWSINIRWKKFFQIYIYQKYFNGKQILVESDLAINFEK